MKADKTSTLALVIAAVLLLVVGAMSYRDYIDDKLEKKWADRAAEQDPAPAGQAPAVAPAVLPAAPAVVAQNQVLPTVPPATAGSPLPQNPPVAWEGNPQTAVQPSVSPVPPATFPPTPVPAPVPAPIAPGAPDPKLSQYQANLDAIRQENALLQKKLEEARNGTTSRPPSNVAPPSAVQSLGNPIANAVPANGGAPSTGPSSAANPESAETVSPAEMQKEIAAMAEQVRKAPALAKVIEYDAEWAILTINGGRDRNIEEDMKFAVRRGSDILGFAKVKFVEDSQAIAELMSPNKFSKTARKPAPGDDIIAFNLY